MKKSPNIHANLKFFFVPRGVYRIFPRGAWDMNWSKIERQFRVKYKIWILGGDSTAPHPLNPPLCVPNPNILVNISFSSETVLALNQRLGIHTTLFLRNFRIESFSENIFYLNQTKKKNKEVKKFKWATAKGFIFAFFSFFKKFYLMFPVSYRYTIG